MNSKDEIIANFMFYLLEDKSSYSSTDSSDTDSESSISESDSDDDSAFPDFYGMSINSTRKDMARVEGYVENVVPNMMERVFKSHFRLKRKTVEAVGNMIRRNPQFIRLSSMTLWKQLLMTLWIVGSPKSFRLIGSNFADIHLLQLFEDVMNLLRNTFFRGKEREAIYKRVFFVTCALRAVEYRLRNRHYYAEGIITCLRTYFSSGITDLYLSSYEVRCVLYSCFILLNKLSLFEQYAQEFDKLMPECPARPQPHSLTHLARCQVRKNLKISKLTLPSAVDKLVLPKILKSFIVSKDLPGINIKNISLQKPVTKSELAGLLFQRPMI